ncbi:MAG: 4-(cytidine 5'-diphospho)-2-C-methyl-D-erythritol kinase [Chitinophagaceae bacterium]|nr:MAG: 4-diphosphocytidyl-2-C-methyl-D-erythritol kinase [Bacteroidetes bacterium OLB11]MCC6447236.1 4-(cytidine 5'-diphospho)-2-C-methyl-D-erythritol kinase [Chitinophagaceae bacterium]
MLQFPNCKINLGLYITSKRDDGYHDLETIFYPLNCADALEIIRSEKLHFQTAGIEIPGDLEQNLILKAYSLLKKMYHQIQAIDIFLLKKIPLGAGLGGGSSNAAFMLKMLNDFFELKLSKNELENYALQLGSDCPFFIENKTALAKGRGEQLWPIELNLSAYHFVIIKPPIHISTSWAFSQIKPCSQRKPLIEIIAQPINTWENELVNDFEAPIMKSYPEIAIIKNRLKECGAIYNSMSGSGSAVFGIFEENQDLKKMQALFPEYFVYVQ